MGGMDGGEGRYLAALENSGSRLGATVERCAAFMRNGSKIQDGRSASNGSKSTDCADGPASAFLLAFPLWQSLERTVLEKARSSNVLLQPIGQPGACKPMRIGSHRIFF